MTQRRQHTAARVGAVAEARAAVLVLAVLLYLYAAVGGAVGVGWLFALVGRLVAGPPPGRPFVTVWSVNLLFAPVALVGAVLASGYLRAVGCALARGGADELGRVSVAVKRLWVWAGVAMSVVVAFAGAMVVAAVLTGEWPG
jgi:hypothetical protein